MKRSEARKCAVIAEAKAYKKHVCGGAREAINQLEQQNEWFRFTRKDKPSVAIAIRQDIERRVGEMLGHLAMIESYANQAQERTEHEIDIHEED